MTNDNHCVEGVVDKYFGRIIGGQMCLKEYIWPPILKAYPAKTSYLLSIWPHIIFV